MSMRKVPGLQLQTSIVQDNVPVEIAAGLFVGSIHAAFNVEALKSKKISHVLNLAGSYAAFPDDFTYLSLSVRDKEYASLLSCLPIAAVFIDVGLKKGGVLVHCAGGRSRSPAVAMAFLIMKQQLPYLSILNHVKTLRPVVSLNAGFDSQLKCLEAARGNVFEANQHLLKARLVHLTQQHENGELRNEVTRKRRQTLDTSSRLTSPRLFKIQSSMEMLISGSDDRGMIGERVPSGYSLSIPLASGCLNETPGKTFDVSFIPALRSMGTMFGCQCCGQTLFCAGAILYPLDHASLTKRIDNCPNDSDFVKALQGQSISHFEDNAGVSKDPVKGEGMAATSMTKKPMLAKLRLRPNSPTVSIRKNCLRTCMDSTSSRRKSASFVQLTTNLELTNLQKVDDNSQLFQILQPVTEESKRTSSTLLSPTKLGVESKKKLGGGIWRSLTSFKSSKRALKPVIENMRSNGQIQHCIELSNIQKPAVTSMTADAESLSICHSSAHLMFLERNAIEWKRNIQQLVVIDKSDNPQTNGVSALNQMTALLGEDLTVMLALSDCHQWFIDPQTWVIDQASSCPEGDIRCPNEACGAIVGEWRWEGSRYPCGGDVAPAFLMKKSAVCVLGNLTSQSGSSRQ